MTLREFLTDLLGLALLWATLSALYIAFGG